MNTNKNKTLNKWRGHLVAGISSNISQINTEGLSLPCEVKQGNLTLEDVRLCCEVQSNGQSDHQDGEEQQRLQSRNQGVFISAEEKYNLKRQIL